MLIGAEPVRRGGANGRIRCDWGAGESLKGKPFSAAAAGAHFSYPSAECILGPIGFAPLCPSLPFLTPLAPLWPLLALPELCGWAEYNSILFYITEHMLV